MVPFRKQAAPAELIWLADLRLPMTKKMAAISNSPVVLRLRMTKKMAATSNSLADLRLPMMKKTAATSNSPVALRLPTMRKTAAISASQSFSPKLLCDSVTLTRLLCSPGSWVVNFFFQFVYATDTVLQLALVFLLVRGPFSRYLIFSLYAVAELAADMAEGIAYYRVGWASPVYRQIYWTDHIALDLLLFLVVITFTYAALGKVPFAGLRQRSWESSPP